VVLIWVYYSSQIILMGAEITRAFAEHRGSKRQTVSADETSRSATISPGTL
jgi:membrane protein